MAKESFACVPTEGFAAFGAEMSTGAWGSIDVTPYVGTDGRAAQPLGNAPVFVALKLQLHWPITALVLAKSGAGTAKQCDDDCCGVIDGGQSVNWVCQWRNCHFVWIKRK
ncbi:MAG TPA: hypothetical protein PK156_13285 [Polyangium sp.]|nr:hypothetical protein [Polyangium sp.]